MRDAGTVGLVNAGTTVGVAALGPCVWAWLHEWLCSGWTTTYPWEIGRVAVSRIFAPNPWVADASVEHLHANGAAPSSSTRISCAFMVGETIAGYRITEVIGRGGMGTVYRAVDEALDKTVALKMMAPKLAEDASFLARFRSEARALAKLDTPGIVRVLAFREEPEGTFLVMEYVEGRTLRSLLRERGALPFEEAMALFDQILDAIAHVHREGVLHRDLKPGNVLITEGGQVKIADFGLAKMRSADLTVTSTYATAGSVCYMSPEQVRGLRNADERSDLFSLGLILYEILAGTLPFDTRQGSFAVQRALVEEPFPLVTAHRPAVPEEVATVLDQVLSKDPEERPARAHALREALADHLPERRMVLPQTLTHPSEEAASTPWWRTPVVLGMVALLVLLVTAFATIQYVLDVPQPMPGEVSTVALDVTTAPPGAAVYLNGDSVGVAPLRLERPPAAEVAVRLAHPVYGALDTTVALRESVALDLSFPETPVLARATDEQAAPTGVAGGEPATDEETEENPTPRPSALPSEGEAADGGELPEADADQPATGSLRITSTPAGAAVWIAGENVGTTPLTRAEVPVGSLNVAVRQEGFQEAARTVAIRPGDETDVTIALDPQPAAVQLEVVPFADVWIDGTLQAEGVNDVFQETLAPGTYTIEARYRGFRWARDVELTPGGSWQQTIDFTREWPLVITAVSADGERIPNAEVRLGDTVLGYTPQQIRLRTGVHILTVGREGFEVDERTIRVDQDTESPLRFTLTPTN